jgi:hypothetical protein
MSRVDLRSTHDVSKPLSPAAARRLIQAILEEGHALSFTDHALGELEDDEMNMVDVTNVLRCCRVVDAAEPHVKTGAWTYRVHTERMCVVVEFPSATKIRIVTGWREKKEGRR